MSVVNPEGDASSTKPHHSGLETFSIVIPAKDEALDIESVVVEVHTLLERQRIKHEIVVVDDNSVDDTQHVLESLKSRIVELVVVQNEGPAGFGRAIKCGLRNASGDAVAIVMADRSDRLSDLAVYWENLRAGADCVFGSRFIEGGSVHHYPWLKLVLNRIVNRFLQLLFSAECNDVTNAFKAYRADAIREIGPLVSNNFNITVELPIKMITHEYSSSVVPTVWTGRVNGASKLKIKEMGSQYLLTTVFLWAHRNLIK